MENNSKTTGKMSTRQTVYGRTLTIVTERANHIYPKTDSSCSRSLSHGSNAMLGLKIYSVKPRLVIIFFLVRYVSLNLKKSEEKKSRASDCTTDIFMAIRNYVYYILATGKWLTFTNISHQQQSTYILHAIS